MIFGVFRLNWREQDAGSESSELFGEQIAVEDHIHKIQPTMALSIVLGRAKYYLKL